MKLIYKPEAGKQDQGKERVIGHPAIDGLFSSEP